MSIRDAFDKALKRLKEKAGIAVTKQKPVVTAVQNDNPPQGGSGVPDKKPNIVIVKDDKCAECDLKKKEVIKETQEDAIKKVFEDLNALTDEEFQAEIDKYKDEPECNPKTCWGECMGEGWCHIAQEWQQKIHHHHFSFVKYVQVNKVRGKQSKKKRKELKRKWKQIHNQRRRKR